MKKMSNIMKIIKSLENSNLLIRGLNRAIKNEEKQQKGKFLSMLSCTIGASLLGIILTGKKVIGAGKRTTRAGEGAIRASQYIYHCLIN